MKTIAYRVDMQEDFMTEAHGRLYVPNAEKIKSNINDLEKTVEKSNVRRIASIDRHFVDDEEFIENNGPFPQHCLDKSYKQRNADGTYGIDLIKEVKTKDAIHIENKIGEGKYKEYDNEELERIAATGNDLVFEKQNYDVFTNPHVENVLKYMGVERAVVYGVATDYCVKAAALGLAKRGIETFVVTNAISGITSDGVQKAIHCFEDKNIHLIRTYAAKELLMTGRLV